MARKLNPARRAKLLSAFVDYLLKNGMSDFSLRPAAAAIGTSARMLLYYFGSKEALLVAAIAEIRKREDARFARESRRVQRGGSIADVALASWRWFAGRPRGRYLRFFFELYGLAAINPKRFRGFIDRADANYYSTMEQGLAQLGIPRREREALATFYLATFRGLSLDVLTTGDRARVDRAAKLLATNLEREVLRLMQRPLEDRSPSAPEASDVGSPRGASGKSTARGGGTTA
jgi:AcrR family transcriptional regulator